MRATHVIEWQLPIACIAVILLSTLYTHHNYSRLLRDYPETQLLRDLASMQIMGILLATAAVSAVKAATSTSAVRVTAFSNNHPMLPQAAARRRQQLPLV